MIAEALLIIVAMAAVTELWGGSNIPGCLEITAFQPVKK